MYTIMIILHGRNGSHKSASFVTGMSAPHGDRFVRKRRKRTWVHIFRARLTLLKIQIILAARAVDDMI